MKKIKKIYFVGIKGVGMAPLAIIAKEALRPFDKAQGSGQAGFEVAGCDIEEEFITDWALKKENIPIFVGFDRSNLIRFTGNIKSEEVLVVTTSAHGGFDNPQTKWAKERSFKVLTQGEALGMFMSGKVFDRADLEGISIAGSHGKTTITAMIATYLTKLGFDPSYTVGTGELFPIGLPGHYGRGEYFIAEADEYVAEPKYDKTPKFLYQKPKFAIFNNIDFDHPDFYKNVDEIDGVFFKFAQNIKKGGLLILNGDDVRLAEFKNRLKDSNFRIITFGQSQNNDLVLTRYRQVGLNSFFWVESHNLDLGEFKLSIPGFHNAKNSLAVISLLIELGISVDKVRRLLPEFLGTKRRFEIVGETKDNTIIVDDYAHHPKEIRETIQTLRAVFSRKKILCIFQGHTFSRTQVFLPEFISSLVSVDRLILIPTFSSAREAKPSEIQEKEVVNEFRNIRQDVIFLKNKAAVVEYVENGKFSDSWVIVTMGAGDVYKIAYSLLASNV